MIIGISGKINSGKDTVGNIIQYLTHCKDDSTSYEEWCNMIHYNMSDWKIKKFADKLKGIVCLLLNCTREQLEDRGFKEKELGEEWWYYINTLFDRKDKKLIPYLSASKNLHNDTSWYIIKPTVREKMIEIADDIRKRNPNTFINALFADYVEDSGYKYDAKVLDKDEEQDAHLEIDNSHDILPGKNRKNFKVKLTSSPEPYNNGLPKWLITDVRFPNELKAVKDKGGISIRVNRPSPCGDVPFNGTQEEWAALVIKHKADNEIFNHPSETALDNAEFDYVVDNNSTIEELIEKVKDILIKEKII